MVYCPSCKIPVFRTRDCKHITCICSFEFCYLCLGDYSECDCPWYAAKCPKCKKVTERNDEDNSVTCECNYVFCYSCLQEFEEGHICKETNDNYIEEDENIEEEF